MANSRGTHFRSSVALEPVSWESMSRTSGDLIIQYRRGADCFESCRAREANQGFAVRRVAGISARPNRESRRRMAAGIVARLLGPAPKNSPGRLKRRPSEPRMKSAYLLITAY